MKSLHYAKRAWWLFAFVALAGGWWDELHHGYFWNGGFIVVERSFIFTNHQPSTIPGSIKCCTPYR